MTLAGVRSLRGCDRFCWKTYNTLQWLVVDWWTTLRWEGGNTYEGELHVLSLHVLVRYANLPEIWFYALKQMDVDQVLKSTVGWFSTFFLCLCARSTIRTLCPADVNGSERGTLSHFDALATESDQSITRWNLLYPAKWHRPSITNIEIYWLVTSHADTLLTPETDPTIQIEFLFPVLFQSFPRSSIINPRWQKYPRLQGSQMRGCGCHSFSSAWECITCEGKWEDRGYWASFQFLADPYLLRKWMKMTWNTSCNIYFPRRSWS